MSHFGDPPYPQNIFQTYRWVCLVKVHLLSTHRTIFLRKELSFYHAKLRSYCCSKWKNHFFSISDGPTLGTPIGYTLYYFAGRDILHKKTSAIRNYKNYNHNFEFMTRGVVGSWPRAILIIMNLIFPKLWIDLTTIKMFCMNN